MGTKESQKNTQHAQKTIVATTTSIHSQVVTDPPILVALQRRQQFRKADLNFQNKWVSHGCKSPVIDAGT